jgi:predicted metal-dependent hydrolase
MMTGMAPSSPTSAAVTAHPDRAIPTRRISFEESLKDLPKHFANDGDLVSSHVAAALSSLFPDGEDYFVRSVRHFRGDITDPVLKRQVAGFIGQEAMHGREHRALNDRLDELGYPVKRYERITNRILRVRERVMSPKSNLAATAALEHFTATLAELVLTSEETREQFGHHGMRDVFVWHALEECEHKAVAFDVYQAVGGTNRMRVVTMNIFRFAFVAAVSLMVIGSLLRDRETYRRGVLRQSFKRFRKSPVVSREIWRKLKDYNRPDFHPDDYDTEALLDHWRTELFGEYGSLNELLVAGRRGA